MLSLLFFQHASSWEHAYIRCGWKFSEHDMVTDRNRLIFLKTLTWSWLICWKNYLSIAISFRQRHFCSSLWRVPIFQFHTLKKKSNENIVKEIYDCLRRINPKLCFTWCPIYSRFTFVNLQVKFLSSYFSNEIFGH